VIERSPAERHRAMSWAQRLKRVFRIEIEQCEHCGGKVRIIASIEDPALVGRILARPGCLRPRPCALRECRPQAWMSRSAIARRFAQPLLPRVARFAAADYTAGNMGFEGPVRSLDVPGERHCRFSSPQGDSS